MWNSNQQTVHEIKVRTKCLTIIYSKILKSFSSNYPYSNAKFDIQKYVDIVSVILQWLKKDPN